MMLNKLKPKSEFSRNVLTLMTGTTIAQAIPIAISPILTRIYTPEDYGILAIFLAITAILGSISNGRYELAIMLPKKDEDAINIFALGFIIVSCLSLFLLILVLLFNDYFATLLGNDEIGFWLYFVPLTVFFTGLWNILNYFNNRRKNYKDLRNATIVKSIVSAIVQLSIGFAKQGPTGLVSASILSQFVANTKLLNNIIQNKLLIAKISKVKIIALAKRYKDFMIHGVPSTLADTGALQLPSLFLPKLFGLAASGHFIFAKRLITLPSGIIANSMSQVFFQQLTLRKNNREKTLPLLKNMIKKLFIIALPIALVIFFSSPYIFPIIFGKNWSVSGDIAQYLAFIFLITFIVSPLSVAFTVSMELRKVAIWQYLYLISSTIFFFLFYIYKVEFEKFLFYFVIHEYILYLIYLFMIIKTTQKMDIINLKGKN